MRVMRSTLLALFLSLTGSALADEVDFLTFKTAVAIDRSCHIFKGFERGEFYWIESDLLDDLPLHQAFTMRKYDQQDYDAEIDAVVAKAEAAALALGCTPAAAQPVNWLRDQASLRIYSDLMIAFERPLPPDLADAARSYEAVLSQFYGANWPNLVERARNRALQQVQAATAKDLESNGGPDMGIDLFTGEFVGSPVVLTFNQDDLYDGALRTLELVFAEVNMERLGYRLVQAGPAPGDLPRMIDAQGKILADIWNNHWEHWTLEGEKFYALVGIGLDGRLRVMTYGEGAKALAGGTVTALAQTGEPPAGLTHYGWFSSDEWWSTATPFLAEATDEPCLGGPCFILPDTFRDVMVAGGADTWARLAFSSSPDAPTPKRGDPTGSLLTGAALVARWQ